MVINNLHIVSVALLPGKTNTPLVINANAILSLTVAVKLFYSIRGRNLQIRYRFSRVQNFQFITCPFLYVWRQFTRELTAKQFCGFFIGKAFYHFQMITPGVMSVKRY
jgi:hypothetical protein